MEYFLGFKISIIINKRSQIMFVEITKIKKHYLEKDFISKVYLDC